MEREKKNRKFEMKSKNKIDTTKLLLIRNNFGRKSIQISGLICIIHYTCRECERKTHTHWMNAREKNRSHVTTNRILSEYWTRFSCRFSTIVSNRLCVGNRFQFVCVCVFFCFLFLVLLLLLLSMCKFGQRQTVTATVTVAQLLCVCIHEFSS